MNARLKYLGSLLAGAALAAGGMTALNQPPEPGDVVVQFVTIRPRYFPNTAHPDGGSFTDVRIQYESCGQPVGRDGGMGLAVCTEFIAPQGGADEALGASMLQLPSVKKALTGVAR